MMKSLVCRDPFSSVNNVPHRVPSADVLENCCARRAADTVLKILHIQLGLPRHDAPIEHHRELKSHTDRAAANCGDTGLLQQQHRDVQINGALNPFIHALVTEQFLEFVKIISSAKRAAGPTVYDNRLDAVVRIRSFQCILQRIFQGRTKKVVLVFRVDLDDADPFFAGLNNFGHIYSCLWKFQNASSDHLDRLFPAFAHAVKIPDK